MWPYTYMDCEFNKLFNYGAEGYCEGKRVTAEGKEITCIGCKDECDKEWRDNFGNDPDDLISHFSIMTDAMELCVSRLCQRNIGAVSLGFLLQ